MLTATADSVGVDYDAHANTDRILYAVVLVGLVIVAALVVLAATLLTPPEPTPVDGRYLQAAVYGQPVAQSTV